ncbi:MAG: class I SAM-dependent methyltransferase [Planctomycetes bacterium]|nr:class I SAM-dependent methyltransferase [Planctomycetota bacterium]
MDFERLHQTWHELGATDPRWAILSEPGRKGGGGDDASFWQSGIGFVQWLATHLAGLGVVPTLGRALDFGCGHGRLTQALAHHFAEVTGVDIAETMLAAARAANRHGDRVRYVHNPRPDLAVFPDASFDFVLSMLVLQHMRNEYAQVYLGEFLRVLRPGGVAFFQLPIEPLAPPPRAGTATGAAPPMLPSALAAATSIVPSHVALAAGEWLWVRVQVHNRGPQVLPAGPGPGAVEVGTRLLRQDGSAVAPAAWTPLPYDLGPGETAAVVVAVQAPATAGGYQLSALPAVQRAWCGHPGNVPAVLGVRVTPGHGGAAAPPPRPVYLAPDRQHRHESGIEVHGMTLAALEAAVHGAGGAIVDLTTDGWAGYEWLSAHLVVRKR